MIESVWLGALVPIDEIKIYNFLYFVKLQHMTYLIYLFL